MRSAMLKNIWSRAGASYADVSATGLSLPPQLSGHIRGPPESAESEMTETAAPLNWRPLNDDNVVVGVVVTK